MRGLKIGHYTNHDTGTGVSVFLFDEPVTGSYTISGGGPASHELAPLDPDKSVSVCHALVLSGGSALGLFAAQGVVNFLIEQQRGLQLPHGGVVPIVPAAAIYDLNYKQAVAPTAEQAYQACVEASANNTASGQVGAGTGATVGKLISDAASMMGGIGHAEIILESGLQVKAYAVVNAVGDIYDERGERVAGAQLANGQWADCQGSLLAGHGEHVSLFERGNTTLVAVFTNAQFSKGELQHISKMAMAGMARAIAPVFTPYDGDIVFSFSLGREQASVLTVGTMAAEVIRLAILDAVKGVDK